MFKHSFRAPLPNINRLAISRVRNQVDVIPALHAYRAESNHFFSVNCVLVGVGLRPEDDAGGSAAAAG